MIRLIAVLGLVLAVWVFAFGDGGHAHASDPQADAAWMDDLGPALERARAEGKDVLVDFTGSDWCGWCIRLHDEVFGRAEFVEAVADDFVLVALDFPRDGGAAWKAMDAELHERNAREAQVFAIAGFPTVLLLTPEGVAYGRSGYRQGGAEAYAEHVHELRQGHGRGAVQGQLDLLRQADADRGARVAAGYALLENTAAVGRADLLEVLAALDPADSRGILTATGVLAR